MGLLRLEELSELSPVALALTVAALSLVLLVLRWVLYPTFDSREPPVLRPKVPFIGHAISIARGINVYYARLHKDKRMPICTLPVLTGKVYVINSPTLISAALRSKALSFDPFITLFSLNALGLSEPEKERFKDPDYLATASKPIHTSLLGEPLRMVTQAGLSRLAADLNAIGPGKGGVKEVSNALDWLRDVMFLAVMRALYGEKNPISLDLQTHIGEFEKKVGLLVLGIAPRLLAPKALVARSAIQQALAPYYLAGHDQGPDVSAFVRNRAAVKRKLGIRAADLPASDFDIPWTAVTNTIPSLLWLFLHIFTRPDYVDRMRAEVLEATAVTGDGATIDASKLGQKPFISACFLEMQRMYNDAGGVRWVMEDTVLRDADGREYLLKKDTNVQWFGGVLHLNDHIWGADAGTFNPDRFVNADPQEEKKRRGAMIPFGGGKHLCPGRMFAVTEITALIGALALAFDVEGVEMAHVVQPPFPSTGMRRPRWKQGGEPKANIRRKRGWEDVKITFTV